MKDLSYFETVREYNHLTGLMAALKKHPAYGFEPEYKEAFLKCREQLMSLNREHLATMHRQIEEARNKTV
jgi:hypothetical protein